MRSISNIFPTAVLCAISQPSSKVKINEAVQQRPTKILFRAMTQRQGQDVVRNFKRAVDNPKKRRAEQRIKKHREWKSNVN